MGTYYDPRGPGVGTSTGTWGGAAPPSRTPTPVRGDPRGAGVGTHTGDPSHDRNQIGGISQSAAWEDIGGGKYQLKSPLSAPTSSYSGLSPSTRSSGGGSGWGYGGGGGGGGAQAGIDQATYDHLMGMLGGTRPEAMQFNAFKNPYFKFNRKPYQNARKDVRQTIRQNRQAGNEEYAAALEATQDWNNPYAGDPRAQYDANQTAMRSLLAANGLGGSVADELALAGQAMNDQSDFMQQRMRQAEGQRHRGNIRALEAEQRGFNQGLDSDRLGLLSGIRQQQTAAQEQHRQNRWANRNQNKMLNWQGRNETRNQNIANRNDWRTSIADPMMQLALAGMKDGKNTLEFGDLPNWFTQRPGQSKSKGKGKGKGGNKNKGKAKGGKK